MDFPMHDSGLMAYVEELEAATKRPIPAGFDSLVVNAIDFLQRGLSLVKSDPKYSVINFCAGIELILKARLLHEHWSLVVSKPGEVSKQNFVAGRFESANTKQCYDRLERVCEETLTEERECFGELANHRNRVVHFFHPAYSAEPDQRLLESIVIQQMRAGALLMRLLNRRWNNEFESHQESIRELRQALQDHRHYLNAKLEVVRRELDKHRDGGGTVWECTYCHMEAATVTEHQDPLKTSYCLVCETSQNHVEIACPECEDGTVSFDAGSGYCNECDVSLDLEFLLDKFGEGKGRAYCPECEYSSSKSVIESGDEYLCLACGAKHDRIDQCEWCSEVIAGDADGTYVNGCLFCDGRMGIDD
jgi:hypothetical protein